ncbi:hypothetical protein [Sorangium sp. So ce385]|uniref:hypothetical protein n=1 Tax=Sorangium sp. So ce385 TaxID=3133308 RepID=UPI003F5B8E1F
MMPTSKLSLATAAAAMVALTSVPASAGDESFAPAAACSPEDGSMVLQYDPYGAVKNMHTTVHAWVTCAVGQDNSLDTNDDLWVYYEDKGLVSGAAGDFLCTAYEVADDWSTVVWADTKYGCSTAGGCASSPGSWTGAGYVRINDISHGGTYFTSVSCSIPIGKSYITALTIDEQ